MDHLQQTDNTVEYLNIEWKAYLFLVSTSVFTFIYACFALSFMYKTRSQIDLFSKRIIYVYLIGFLSKNTVAALLTYLFS